MTLESAPSVKENPDCQSNVKPPLLPKCETANVFRCMPKMLKSLLFFKFQFESVPVNTHS